MRSKRVHPVVGRLVHRVFVDGVRLGDSLAQPSGLQLRVAVPVGIVHVDPLHAAAPAWLRGDRADHALGGREPNVAILIRQEGVETADALRDGTVWCDHRDVPAWQERVDIGERRRDALPGHDVAVGHAHDEPVLLVLVEVAGTAEGRGDVLDRVEIIHEARVGEQLAVRTDMDDAAQTTQCARVRKPGTDTGEVPLRGVGVRGTEAERDGELSPGV